MRLNLVGLGSKTVAYTGQGNVRVVAYQQDQPDAFYHYYEYDADTRLKRVYTSTKKPEYQADEYTLQNPEQFALQATYAYYLHGPSKQVVLADGLQTTDYYYTVQGWLKAINNPNDASNPDNDAFAMQLDYFAGDYENAGSGIVANALPAQADYSGNIQQQTWRQQTRATADFYRYQYSYDQRYQLQSATFGRMSSGSFVQDDTYSVSQLSYDANGNIQTLLRQGTPQPNDFTGVNKYKYRKKDGIELNQLESVGTYASYEYNAIGQMVKQQAEAGSSALSQYLEYDVSGKAIGVYSYAQENEQGTWEYEEANLLHRYHYDEKGYRVRKEDVSNGRQTYYVRDASGSLLSTYEQQTSTSDIERTEVPIYGSGRLGIAHRNTDNTLSYLYELKDHLGNVRSRLMRSEQGVDLVSWHTYYPYGLENKALSSSVSSYPLRHRYQGEFAEYDQETKLNHFELRQYDAVVGRWLSVDPMGQFHSPYVGMGNDPINGVDPDGAWVKGGGFWRNLFNSDAQVHAMMQTDGVNDRGIYSATALEYEDQSYLQQVNKMTGFTTLTSVADDGALGGTAGYYQEPQSFDALWTVRYVGATVRSEAMLSFMMIYPTEAIGAGVSAGLRSINWFGARGGYGLFGRNGLKVGNYKIEKIEALYANRPVGTGTLLSVKQMRPGGNLLRWDYGLTHGTQTMGFHSTFRFNMRGATYGSTSQYPVTAPFRFWRYKQ